MLVFKTIGLFLVIIGQLGCSEKPTEGFIRNPSPPSPVDTTTPTPSGTNKTYLALGDSYTIGASVDESQRFPIQTQQWLLANGIKMDKPEIIATSGWTTLNLQDGIAAKNFAGTYDVVSLLIGVNDQYRGFDLAGYKDRFRALLQKAIQLAGNNPAHVFVLSIPDYSATPFGKSLDVMRIRADIDAFNRINKELALQYGSAYLDITPSTREAATDPSLVAPDGLHPSGKEYQKWAERLGPLMKAVLQ